MKGRLNLVSALLLAAASVAVPSTGRDDMHLGNFSVSLAVKDIHASRAFYEKLGFAQVHGETGQGWAIMKNGSTKIGLFQGMFDRNMLTFNPGWDQDGQPDGKSEDVRIIRQRLQAEGLDVGAEIESKEGPGSFMLTDPDGNPILFDQHL
ncbi:MAG TPA: VOC family protein [Allosphingosinicella sp.]